jgi:hypothetical protein
MEAEMMDKGIGGAIAGAAALMAFSITPAAAAGKCGASGDVTKMLSGKYQEDRRAFGLINEKAIMEVFISPKGTWTMVITDHAGMSCVFAAGESWKEKPVLAMGPAS